MSTPRSGWRMAIARRASVVGGTAESQEINFAMGFGEGIEIAHIEFGLTIAANSLTTARVQNNVRLSVHAETGALEEPLGPSDDFELNSEVIAFAVLLVDTNDNALGEQSNFLWAPGPSTHFIDILGAPMLLASNPTWQVDGESSTIAISNPFMRMWYRYVELSNSELLRLFALRR